MVRTFTAEDEEQLRQLHAVGVSRNEIARRMGWAVGAITNHSNRLGLSFNREAVRAATEARQVDLIAGPPYYIKSDEPGKSFAEGFLC